MTTLITGAAGFIGSHVAHALLARGEEVIGLDSLNTYYDVKLKQARLANLAAQPGFSFHKVNIAEQESLNAVMSKHKDIDRIVHLAAQAGVRYSLTNPEAYAEANMVGHLNMLEAARALPNLQHMVYASSSSVYGANEKLPFSVSDPVDRPISLYAATKRSAELMSHTYSHLFEMPLTGLRFFTVYGPWGRPDMSAFIFTKAILEDQELPVFNHGKMRRNFTYIDDIVLGTIGCLDNPAVNGPKHRLYNIGNNKSEELMHFIEVLEQTIGKKAKLKLEPMQPGDVKETIADITDTTRDFDFKPRTDIEQGLANFVNWYRKYHQL